METNWRRFVLFTCVAVALGILTALTSAHQHVMIPIVVILFFTLFIVVYRVPGWEPKFPAITKRRLLLLSTWLVIVLLADVWYEHSKLILKVPPELMFLIVFLSACMTIFFRRKHVEK